MAEGRCHERMRGMVCSISPDIKHDVHVALDEEGRVMGRWRMVAEEVLPTKETDV